MMNYQKIKLVLFLFLFTFSATTQPIFSNWFTYKDVSLPMIIGGFVKLFSNHEIIEALHKDAQHREHKIQQAEAMARRNQEIKDALQIIQQDLILSNYNLHEAQKKLGATQASHGRTSHSVQEAQSKSLNSFVYATLVCSKINKLNNAIDQIDQKITHAHQVIGRSSDSIAGTSRALEERDTAWKASEDDSVRRMVKLNESSRLYEERLDSLNRELAGTAGVLKEVDQAVSEIRPEQLGLNALLKMKPANNTYTRFDMIRRKHEHPLLDEVD